MAGVHHLRLLQQTFAKDQQNKQNYEAVVCLTSDSVTTMLSNMSDAKVLECIWM